MLKLAILTLFFEVGVWAQRWTANPLAVFTMPDNSGAIMIGPLNWSPRMNPGLPTAEIMNTTPHRLLWIDVEFRQYFDVERKVLSDSPIGTARDIPPNHTSVLTIIALRGGAGCAMLPIGFTVRLQDASGKEIGGRYEFREGESRLAWMDRGDCLRKRKRFEKSQQPAKR